MKRRKIALFLLWILSLAAISCYGGAISYGLFFSVSLLPVISFVYLLSVFARFRIYQEIESRNIVCGQPVSYYFVLQNGGKHAFAGVSVRLFSGFSYVEEIPDDVEYELLPGEQHSFHTKLVCRYRGEYEVGVKEVVLTDFFRIFRLHYRLPSTIKALVYPRTIHKEALQSIEDISTFLCRESRRLQTEADVTVRDYVAGDALKYIHWKATAREQKLKTRNRVGEEQQGITVFYDTKRYSKKPECYLPLENQILELVLALGYFFAERNAAFTVWHSKRSLQNHVHRRCVSGIGDFEAFYQEAAQTVFDEGENSRQLFEQLAEQGSLWDSSAVIAVFHEISQSTIRAAEQLAAGGAPVILYVVTDDDIKEYVRQGNSRLQIIAVSTSVMLEEWL